MAGYLVHLRAELVAQSEIQRQARPDPPVILEIKAEGGEPIIPVKLRPRRGGPEKFRFPAQEALCISKLEDADRIILE